MKLKYQTALNIIVGKVSVVFFLFHLSLFVVVLFKNVIHFTF